jgi:GNAT superfamily N-acetyltransferase
VNKASIEIVPLAESDIEAVAASLARAFADDPLLRYIQPNDGERKLNAPSLFVDDLQFARIVGVANVPAGNPAGAAYGWVLPIDIRMREKVAPPEPPADMEAFLRFVTVVSHIDAHMHRVIPMPSWFLAALGVDPAHQRKGIGSALVQTFLDRAAADRLPFCLWTTNERNRTFYRGLGLEEIGESIEPTSGLPYWILRR